MVILGAALAASGGTATAARAGAWLQDEGTAYVRVAGGVLTTRGALRRDGDRVQWDTSGGGFRDARYQDLALSLYTEAG